jgi:hypothetical protein
MVYGFDLSWDKYHLFLNATLGGNRQIASYSRGLNIWPANKGVSYAVGDVTYGYTVFNKGKWKIIPFGGFCFTELNFDNLFLRLSNFNFILGTTTDYKIAKNIQLVPNIISESREYSETSVRTRLYVTNASFYPDLKGLTVNLSVGVTLNGKFVEVFR